MKKIFKIVLLILLFNNILKAQVVCGHEAYLNKIFNDSISKNAFDSLRVKIRALIQKNNQQTKFVAQTNTYVIPVVFHLIGNSVSSGLSDAQVQNQLAILNDGFSNSLGSTYGVADDAQISFCLAQNAPSGTTWATFGSTTNGITRISSALANSVTNSHNMDVTGSGSQQQLSQVVYFNNAQYLNIWVVNSISLTSGGPNNVLGYSPFPLLGSGAYIDGVIMRLDAFGLNSTNTMYNQGRTLIHEVGHYLGLFHTFQFGCAGMTTSDCASSGDECCDTPPSASANQNDCSIFSAMPPNSCVESPNLFDMYENHMDYAYDNINTCRNTFTDDQVNRMHATIQLLRSQLVSFQNLIVTGITSVTGCQANAISPIFITNLPGNSSQVCTNQSIGFVAAAGATTYNWSFPGGSPAIVVGTNMPTNITYPSPGTYNVTLTITDGLGNIFTSTSQIFVTTCTPYSGNRANWYFGQHASINFSTGIGVSQNPSEINTLEQSASISDANGNLLFYTDGNSVWNSSHVFFNNGANTLNGSPNGWLAGNNLTSSQGVVIIPKPSNPDRYFIYTTSDVTNSMAICNGISQYEVDVTTPIGGNVLSTTAINPLNNYAVDESIIAIPHCNGSDYWLISKPRNNNQSSLPNPGSISNINLFFASYLIDASGINNVPVLSASAPLNQSANIGGGNDGITQIAVSPDKKFICFGDANGSSYLYYFDCSSGLLNYVATLNGVTGYGFAFSPNSKVLYAKSANTILQYDLNNISQCQNSPPFKVFSTSYTGFDYGSLQLGPDGRIYVSYILQNSLGVINFPNILNTSNTSNDCGFNAFGIPLLFGQLSYLDLPNDIIGQIGSLPDDFSFSIKNCNEVCFTNLGCGNSFSWDFDDGSSIVGVNSPITTPGSTTGNFEYPHHTYSNPGTYTVKLSIDGHPTISHVVTIAPASVPSIVGPNPVCNTNTGPISYFGPNGFQYSWSATNCSPATGNLQTFDATFISFPAVLNLTVTDLNGCTNSTSINITQVSTPPTVNAGADVSICPPITTAQLNGSTSNGSVTWGPSASLSCSTCLNPIATPGVTTTYILTAANGCGASSDQITVTVQPCTNCTACNPIGTSGSITSNAINNVFCINNNVTITGTKLFIGADFKIAAGVKIIVPSGAALRIINSHLYACGDMWQGIEVQNGGQLTISNSLVEDALVAVDVTGNVQASGNVFNLINSTFNRNDISVFINGYSQATTPYPFGITNCVFTCRDIPFGTQSFPSAATIGAAAANPGAPFTNNLINNATYSQVTPSAFLKAPAPANSKPTAGIRLKAVGVTQNPQSVSPTYFEFVLGGANNTNIIDNQRIGVDLIGSNFTSYNTIYQNTATFSKGGTAGGIGINAYAPDETFNNRLKVTSTNNTSAKGNKFVDCSRAINSFNYFEHLITLNDIRSSQVFGTATANSRGKYGVKSITNRYKAYNISSNTIYNIENGVILDATFGLLNIGSITSSSSQYAGAVNVDNNIISPQVGGSAISTNYVSNAIALSDIISSPYNIIPVSPSATSVIQTANNTITDVYRGIAYLNWEKATSKISSNTVKLVVDPTSATPQQFGIALSGAQANVNVSQVNSNNVTGFGITANTKVYGIADNISSGINVNCNTTSNTYHGIAFGGSCPNTKFNNNLMSNHKYGFALLNNGVIGQQGTSTSPQDNRWTGTWTGNFKTATINSTSQTSKLYIRTSATSPFNPNLSTFNFGGSSGTDDYGISNIPPTLIPTTSNPFYIGCPVVINGGGNPPGFVINQLEQIALDVITYQTNIQQTKTINKNQVYRLLNADPTLMASSSILQTFYANSQSTNRKVLADVETNLVTGDITTANNLNAAVSSTDGVEINYKAFYNLAIKQAEGTITTNDSLALATLAYGCPFTDGAMVYQARVMLNVMYDNYTVYPDNCPEQSNARLGEKHQDETSIKDENNFDAVLFPNPGALSFNMATFGLTDGNIDVSISDVTGKVVFKNTLSVVNALTLFNLEVKNGIYFVKITNNDKTIIKKLVVQQ